VKTPSLSLSALVSLSARASPFLFPARRCRPLALAPYNFHSTYCRGQFRIGCGFALKEFNITTIDVVFFMHVQGMCAD
jgi:hypothetical protein